MPRKIHAQRQPTVQEQDHARGMACKRRIAEIYEEITMQDWVKEAVAESCIQVTEAMHKVLLCSRRHACLVAIPAMDL